MLIVGCGCRGRGLARELRADGHTVRGTTRDPRAAGALEADGVEACVADPDRIGTLVAALDGVAVVCWLLGSAAGGPGALAALHGPRLRSFCERIVDTTVRGLVYEAAGTVPADVLAGGAAIARDAHGTWRIPLRVVEADPREHATWAEAMRAAVASVLGSG